MTPQCLAALAVLSCLAGTSCCEAQPQAQRAKTDRFGGVRKRIRQRMKRDGIPSIVVGVAHKGKIVWEEGFGFADEGKKIRATPHTIYRISSIGKVLTATAIMVLVEKGMLNLDRPVNDYLGKAKLTARVGNAKNATIRRLCNHTSGLPRHDQYFFPGEKYQRQPADRMETIIQRYGNIVWLPGERPQYSNLALGILGHVVARRSGVAFPEFMQREVFGPLKMTRSSVGLSKKRRPLTAVPYLAGKRIPLPANTMAGAGDMWCSAHDLLRFGLFHLKSRLPGTKAILTHKSIDAMQVTASRVPGSDFGIGWGTDDNYRGTGFPAVGHHGGNAGWVSFLLLLPKEDLSVVVMANTNGAFTDPIADDVISVLVPEYGRRRTAVLEKRKKNRKKPKPRPPFKPPAKLVGEWRGHVQTFEGRIPVTMTFDASGKARAKVGDQPRTELIRPSLRGKCFTADLKADIKTADTRRLRSGILELDLVLRGRTINGAIYANSLFGHKDWGGYRINHWIELKKVR